MAEFKMTEVVLFIGGAVLTVAVFVIAVLLYRVASREHRQQLEQERREQSRKGAGE
jgi:cytochrome c-type biogenesis protein CcmH/NrfF